MVVLRARRPILGWYLCCTLFLVALVGDAFAAGLEARLDRTRIVEGETVTLTLRDDGQGGDAPDLTPLNKDFDVLSRGQSSGMQMINGRTNSWHDWRISLAPKSTGKLTVPALRVGKAMSQPITLEVLPASQAASEGRPQPVIIEIDATPEKPVVQGKVVYTVRVLASMPMRLRGLTDPVVHGAIIERLGDEKRYQSERGGQNYHVIERRYAIFPQHSGSLQIDAPVLSAEVAEPGQRRGSRGGHSGGRDPFSGFDSLFGRDPFAGLGSMFERTRPLRLRGRHVTLDVDGLPAGASSPWLPAESLTLNEAWSPNPPTFRVGEPVTRTLVITAQGLSPTQLPDLAPALPQGVSSYPDRPHIESRVDGDTLIAQKVLKFALVPSAEGTFRLPAVELSWWDTTRAESRVARLPARDIQVLPGRASVSASPLPRRDPGVAPVPTQVEDVPVPTPAETMSQSVRSSSDETDHGEDVSYWPWVAVAFALAWLISTTLWWRARRNRRVPVADASPVAVRPDAGHQLRQFERACRDNDAKAARTALLSWAAARWPGDSPRRLEELASRLSGDAGPILRDLDQTLYSADAGAWDGDAARRALLPLLRDTSAARSSARGEPALPPLYG